MNLYAAFEIQIVLENKNGFEESESQSIYLTPNGYFKTPI